MVTDEASACKGLRCLYVLAAPRLKLPQRENLNAVNVRGVVEHQREGEACHGPKQSSVNPNCCLAISHVQSGRNMWLVFILSGHRWNWLLKTTRRRRYKRNITLLPCTNLSNCCAQLVVACRTGRQFFHTADYPAESAPSQSIFRQLRASRMMKSNSEVSCPANSLASCAFRWSGTPVRALAGARNLLGQRVAQQHLDSKIPESKCQGMHKCDKARRNSCIVSRITIERKGRSVCFELQQLTTKTTSCLPD